MSLRATVTLSNNGCRLGIAVDALMFEKTMSLRVFISPRAAEQRSSSNMPETFKTVRVFTMEAGLSCERRETNPWQRCGAVGNK